MKFDKELFSLAVMTANQIMSEDLKTSGLSMDSQERHLRVVGASYLHLQSIKEKLIESQNLEEN